MKAMRIRKQFYDSVKLEDKMLPQGGGGVYERLSIPSRMRQTLSSRNARD